MFLEKLAERIDKLAAYDWQDEEDRRIHQELANDPTISDYDPSVRNSFRNWRNFQAGLGAAGALAGIGGSVATKSWVPAAAGLGLVTLPSALYAYGNNKDMGRYEKFAPFRRNANIQSRLDEMGLGSRAMTREQAERSSDRGANFLNAMMIASALASRDDD